MSEYSEAHLLSLVSTIGTQSAENCYRKDDYCEASLQDIIRFLQNDSSERQVFLQLTAWNVLAKDLIPLLSVYYEDTCLSFLVVKLFVFITLPPDKESETFPEQARALSSTLRVILDHADIFPKIMLLLSHALEKIEARDSTLAGKDVKVLQLVFTFFRNLLLIVSSINVTDSRNLYSRIELCEIMQEVNFLELLSTVLQDVRKAPLNVEISLLVEIYELLLRVDDVERAKDESTSSLEEDAVETRTLQSKHGPKFGIRTEAFPRFSGTYVQQRHQDVPPHIHRGKRDKLHVAGKTQILPAPHTLQCLEAFVKSLKSAAVNQFLLRAWENLRRMKQQTGMSIEYTTQMTCFFNLCAYFVAIFPEHNSDSLGTEQIAHMDYPVANIFTADFLTWLRREWLELEQNKLFEECSSLIELTARIARALTQLQHLNDERIQLACQAICRAYWQEDSECGIMRSLRSQLKSFKWSSMPIRYLRALFTLLDATSAMLMNEVSPENTMQAVNLVHAEQLESIFLDGIVVKNRLRLMQLSPSKNMFEATHRVRFLKQLEPSAYLHLSFLLSLRTLSEDPHSEVSYASDKLLRRTVRQLTTPEREGKGSTFVSILTQG